MNLSPRPARSRLRDRQLWLLVGLAALALATSIGFALWINAEPPLHPVPVATKPSA